MAVDGGSLTNGRNSNLEKQVSAHEFSLETDRHPRQTFTFLATIGSSNSSLSNKRNAPGRDYFTPVDVQLQRKMKSPSFILPMDVSAKQRLSYHVALFPFACVRAVSPHINSAVVPSRYTLLYVKISLVIF